MNDNELAVDLLWADPDVNVQGLQFQANRRGIGHSFGQEVINRVRRRFGLDLIIRAHQVGFWVEKQSFNANSCALRWSWTGTSSSTTTWTRA